MAKFNDKISTLINAQLPEFVVEQHPKFASFLKSYYQLLESAELQVEQIETTDGILLETETNQENLLILDAGRLGSTRTQLDSGDKVLTEDTAFGKFQNGETVTGSTSGATAVIVAEDLDNTRLFITSQNKFVTGETINGSSSNARAVIKGYTPNPIQNLSELVQYKDPDRVIDRFLSQFRNEFLHTIPESLATGVDKRKLIKNIKSLYQLKGTAEGHRIFFNLLFGENSETLYPREQILRVSDGQWGSRKIIRGIDVVGSTTSLIGRTITGETSNATAIVENVFRFTFGANQVTEFIVDSDTIVGTFQIGEVVQGTESDINDVFIKSTITGIPGSKIISNDGALYDSNATIRLTGGGQGALFQVGNLGGGAITETIIDDGGFDFEIGDNLTFNAGNTSGAGAQAFVSVVNGGFSPELGIESGDTLFPENSTSTDPLTKYLAGPVISVKPGSVTGGNTFGDIRGSINDADDTTSNAVLSLTGQTSGATATVRYNIDGTTLQRTTETIGGKVYDKKTDFNETVLYISYVGSIPFKKGEIVTVLAADSSTYEFTLSDTFGRIGVGINREGVDETNIADRDSIYQMLRNLGAGVEEDDHITLEGATSEGDSYSGDKIVQERNTGVGDITDIFLISGGSGYTSLPIINFDITLPDGTVTSSSSGKDFILKCFGTEIGRILDIKTIEQGVQHELSPSPPSIEFINNSIVKSVSGTFTTSETVTGATSGFTAEVNSFDVARGLLRLDAVVGSPVVGEIITGATSGASGKLHITDHASATVNVVAVADTDGAFLNEDGWLSEQTMKVQDSLYYQDFSYVIKVGESINSWRDAFSKTMHTSGFYFSGEVAIENRLNAKIKSPVVGEISGVSESPILGLLTTLFARNVRRKMGTLTDGTTLRATPQVAYTYADRPSSSTRDTTVRLSFAVTAIISRVRRQVANVNIAQGFAYAGPKYGTLNKYHNTIFRGGDRLNGSGITFDVLSGIKIFGTRSSLDGEGAVFKATSDVNGRLLKSAFTIPADISIAANLFSNTVQRFDQTNLTFDDTNP